MYLCRHSCKNRKSRLPHHMAAGMMIKTTYMRLDYNDFGPDPPVCGDV